jgi:hypothetical protein
MGNLRKKWFLIVIVALLLAIAFTYLRFRLEMYRNQQLMNTWLDKFPRNPVPEDLGLFSSRFRSYFQVQYINECIHCNSWLRLPSFTNLVSAGENQDNTREPETAS